MPFRKFSIPLSRLQLTWDKRRLFAAVSGIVFAVVLMTMQLSFRDALFVAAVQFHHALDTDLVLLHTQYEYSAAAKPFSHRILQQTLAHEHVRSVTPLYVGMANWKNQENQREIPIVAIGFDPAQPAMHLPGLSSNLHKLHLPDVLLFDRGSKPDYGPARNLFESGQPVSTEVSGRLMTLEGLFNLGISFAADGNIIMSDLNFLNVFPNRREGAIDIGLIRIDPDAAPETVAARIAEELPPDVRVLTKTDYIALEKNYWDKRSPIGFIFNLGALVGFMVGSVIVYQILYTDVADHLREYATLKAMGYTDRHLFGVVIRQALYLCILGFIPGWCIASIMGALVEKHTLLPAGITLERSLTVLTLAVLMCTGSASLSLRKLRSADPADIF